MSTEVDSNHIYQEQDEEQAIETECQSASQSQCQSQTPMQSPSATPLDCAKQPHSPSDLKSESPSPSPQPATHPQRDNDVDDDDDDHQEEEDEEEDEGEGVEEEEEINDDDINSNSLTAMTQHHSLPSSPTCTLSPTTSTTTTATATTTTTTACQCDPPSQSQSQCQSHSQSVLDVLSEEIARFFLCTRPDSTTTEQQTQLKQYIIDCGKYLEYQCLRECRDYKMNKGDKLKHNHNTLISDHDMLMERMCESEPLEEKHWDIFTFGSESWGTSCTDSDIDMGIFLNFKNIRPDKKYLLDRLASIIQEYDQGDELHVKRILNAKYPILRIRHRNHALNIKVDVSIADRHCRNRDQHILRIIRVFEEQFAIPVKELIVFIKYWSKQKGINNAYLCYLNSFGYTLLVLKFLEYYCLDLPAEQRDNKSLGYLAYKFFEFYSKQYRPNEHAIVLTMCTPRNYRNGLPFTTKTFYETGYQAVMQINDPINELNNVAQKVGEDQLLQIMYRLDEARKLIEAQMKNEHHFVDGQRNPIFWKLTHKTYYQPYYQPWRYRINHNKAAAHPAQQHAHAPPPRPAAIKQHHTLQLLHPAGESAANSSSSNLDLHDVPLNMNMDITFSVNMDDTPQTSTNQLDAITEQHRDLIADQAFRDNLLTQYEMATISATKDESKKKKPKHKNKKKTSSVSSASNKAESNQAVHRELDDQEEYEVKYLPSKEPPPRPPPNTFDDEEATLKHKQPHVHELEVDEKENEHENEKKSVSTSSSTSIAEFIPTEQLIPTDQLSDITTNDSLPTESEFITADGDAIYASYQWSEPYQSNMNLYALSSASYLNMPFRSSPSTPQSGHHHGRHYHHRAAAHRHGHHGHHHNHHNHPHHHHHHQQQHYSNNNNNSNVSNNGHYNGNYNAMAAANVYYHDGYAMNYYHGNNGGGGGNNSHHRKRKERQSMDRRHAQSVNMNHHQRRRHKYGHV